MSRCSEDIYVILYQTLSYFSIDFMTAPLCCPLLVWLFLLLQIKLMADLCLFFCRMMNLSYLCFPLSAGGGGGWSSPALTPATPNPSPGTSPHLPNDDFYLLFIWSHLCCRSCH